MLNDAETIIEELASLASQTLMQINTTHEKGAYWLTKSIIANLRVCRYYIEEIRQCEWVTKYSEHLDQPARGARICKRITDNVSNQVNGVRTEITFALRHFLDDRDATRLEEAQRLSILVARTLYAETNWLRSDEIGYARLLARWEDTQLASKDHKARFVH